MNKMKIRYKIKLKRNGKTVVQRRTKRVAISGKIISKPKLGEHTSRFGTRIHGLKVAYINKIEGGAGRGGRIKKMKVEKLIPIPRGEFSIKISK